MTELTLPQSRDEGVEFVYDLKVKSEKRGGTENVWK